MHKRIGGTLATALMLALLESCGGGSGGSTDPTHVDKDRPTLTSLSPASVPVGSPAFTLILNGSGFMAGGTVTWAGTNIGTYTFVSSTQITMPIPASLVAKQGKVNIVVTNPGTGATPSDFISFDVTALTLSGCVLFGTYDFFFTGFDSTGPMTTAGAFGVDVSGKVSGEVDYKNRTETRVAEPVTGGSCTNGPIPNTGKLTITTASGTSTYTFASQGISPVRPWSHGRIGRCQRRVGHRAVRLHTSGRPRWGLRDRRGGRRPERTAHGHASAALPTPARSAMAWPTSTTTARSPLRHR